MSPARMIVAAAAITAGLLLSSQAALALLTETVYGQASFTTSSSGVTATSLFQPTFALLDSVGNLYVADLSNNRVLRYPSTCASSGCAADRVYGQPDFVTRTAGTTATTLRLPTTLAFDSAGNLYVAEYNNNRVVRFPSSCVSATGCAADRVYGQTSFTARLAAATLTGLNQPYGVVLDNAGNIYVADASNNRVVRYPASCVSSTGCAADRVYGQSSFTTRTSGVSATSLSFPWYVTLDAASDVFVADRSNNRVVRYPASCVTAAGCAADRVFGQSSFTTNTSGTSGTSLNAPFGLVVDQTGNLLVADYQNSRVVRFPASCASPSGCAADSVYGPASFTANTCAVSSSALCTPVGISLSSAGDLYVADYGNNRILVNPPIAATTAPGLGLNGATGTGYAAAYTLGGLAEVLTGSTVTVTDPLSNLASLTATITGNFQSGDTLDATVTGTSISKSYNAGTGVLTLSGSDTLTHYQQVLTSVRFSTTSGSTATRSIDFVATDANSESNAAVTTSLTVSQATTTTSLTATSATAAYGPPRTFTVDVTSGTGVPSGAVVVNDGSIAVAAGSLDGTGHAQVSTTISLAVGTHSLSAAYGGNTDDAPSTSSTLTYVVSQGVPTLQVAPHLGSSNPSTSGSPLQVDASVSGAAQALTPTGTVHFTDAADSLDMTATVSGGIASSSIGALPIGTHTIVATYSGDANYTTASASVVETVTKANSNTVLSLGSGVANPSAADQAVPLGVAVKVLAPGTGTPTGHISVYDGANLLGGATLDGTGQATFVATNLLPGTTHALTAVYEGDATTFGSTSGALSQSVAAPVASGGGGHSSPNRSTPIAVIDEGSGGGGGQPQAPALIPVVRASIVAAPPLVAEPPKSRLISVVPTDGNQNVQQIAVAPKDTSGFAGALPSGQRITVEVAAQGASVSLGGGAVVTLGPPVDLHLVAHDVASGQQVAVADSLMTQTLQVSLPVVAQPTTPDQTFAWLAAVHDDDGSFLGYMRLSTDFDATSGNLVLQIPSRDLQNTSLLPVLLQPAWVESFVSDVHIWSSPFSSADDFGVAGPTWTTYTVLGPQVGGRILVNNPVTNNVGWIDANGVGPVTEPL